MTKRKSCFGFFGLTDDCFSCWLADECEAEAIEEAEDYGLETDREDSTNEEA